MDQSSFKLVYDRLGSRRMLLKALAEAKIRLIMVCPYLTNTGIDSDVLSGIEKLLHNGVSVHIGWGYDIKESNQVLTDERFDILSKKSVYNGLVNIHKYRVNYKEYFELKCINTHEKYFVCDDKFAMLGSHNFLSSNQISDIKEIGICTSDSKIIQELIERYNSSKTIVTILETQYEKQIAREKLILNLIKEEKSTNSR
jgi:phosphatidylserine/phosphatidylglycerophosphate/cardiolipin synthase-like enzyme